LLFSNPTHKTETGTASRWETVKGNPLWNNQTIYPIRNRDESINMILTMFIGPVQKLWFVFIVPVVVQWIHWMDSGDEPHPRFLVQDHILSVGGDALTIVTTYQCWSRW
jgi:hypothetical protein